MVNDIELAAKLFAIVAFDPLAVVHKGPQPRNKSVLRQQENVRSSSSHSRLTPTVQKSLILNPDPCPHLHLPCAFDCADHRLGLVDRFLMLFFRHGVGNDPGSCLHIAFAIDRQNGADCDA
jgi:hypothetical protein